MPRPKLDLDEYLPDPFGTLARLRRQSWIADSEPAPGVLGYDDVRTLLSDGRLHANFPDFLRSFGISSGPFFEWNSISPLNRDGEEHRRAELQESLLALTTSIECPRVGSNATWKPPIGINGPQTLPITFSARV